MTACPAGATVHVVLPEPASTATVIRLALDGAETVAVLGAGQAEWIATTPLTADTLAEVLDPPGLTVDCPTFRAPAWPAPVALDTGAQLDPPLAAMPASVLPFTGADPAITVLGAAVLAIGIAGIALSAGHRRRPNGAR